MRQSDILAILREHDRPMTSLEIIESKGLKRTPSLLSNVYGRLRRLEKWGMVRVVGIEEESHRKMWEAVE